MGGAPASAFSAWITLREEQFYTHLIKTIWDKGPGHLILLLLSPNAYLSSRTLVNTVGKLYWHHNLTEASDVSYHESKILISLRPHSWGYSFEAILSWVPQGRGQHNGLYARWSLVEVTQEGGPEGGNPKVNVYFLSLLRVLELDSVGLFEKNKGWCLSSIYCAVYFPNSVYHYIKSRALVNSLFLLLCWMLNPGSYAC